MTTLLPSNPLGCGTCTTASEKGWQNTCHPTFFGQSIQDTAPLFRYDTIAVSERSAGHVSHKVEQQLARSILGRANQGVGGLVGSAFEYFRGCLALCIADQAGQFSAASFESFLPLSTTDMNRNGGIGLASPTWATGEASRQAASESPNACLM